MRLSCRSGATVTQKKRTGLQESGDEGEEKKKRKKKNKKELNVEEEMAATETLKAEREIAEHKKLQVCPASNHAGCTSLSFYTMFNAFPGGESP